MHMRRRNRFVIEWGREDDALGSDQVDSSSDDDDDDDDSSDDGEGGGLCVITTRPPAPFPSLALQHRMSDRLGRNVYDDDESEGAKDEGTDGYECCYFHYRGDVENEEEDSEQDDKEEDNEKKGDIGYDQASYFRALSAAIIASKDVYPPKPKRQKRTYTRRSSIPTKKSSSPAKKSPAKVQKSNKGAKQSKAKTASPATKTKTSRSPPPRKKPPRSATKAPPAQVATSPPRKKPPSSAAKASPTQVATKSPHASISTAASTLRTRPAKITSPTSQPLGAVAAGVDADLPNTMTPPRLRAMPQISEEQLEEQRKRKMLDRVNRSKWFLERKKMRVLKNDTFREEHIDSTRKHLQTLQSSVDQSSVDQVLEQIVPEKSNTAIVIVSANKESQSKPKPASGSFNVPAMQNSKKPARGSFNALALQNSKESASGSAKALTLIAPRSHPQNEPTKVEPNKIVTKTGPNKIVTKTRASPFTLSSCEVFQKMVAELLRYKKERGHCNVQCKDPKWGELGRWVKRQRYQYKLWVEGDSRSSLTPSRINALDSIGMVWDSQSRIWNIRYQEMLDFRKKNGHCQIPRYYAPNRSLGSWVRCQRSYYRAYLRGETTSLVPERVKMLEAAGFDDLYSHVARATEESNAYTHTAATGASNNTANSDSKPAAVEHIASKSDAI